MSSVDLVADIAVTPELARLDLMVKNNGARGSVAFLSWVMVAIAVVLFVGFVYTVFIK